MSDKRVLWVDTGRVGTVWVYRCASNDRAHDVLARAGDLKPSPPCPTCGKPTQPTVKKLSGYDPRIDPKTDDPRRSQPM